ncbi:MAG: hypothetical protein KBA95_16180 [Acidobacteria bacterium]|nr:hypothetical protein [Acidobacteriota bacterium]
MTTTHAPSAAQLRDALLTHLHRGGAHGYWWLNPGKRTVWWPVAERPTPPRDALNCYVGVNPTNAPKGKHERALLGDVVALNCLYGDYDAKDYGGEMATALARIGEVPLPPSVIVNTGGGYQAYWLLAEPFLIADEASRRRAAEAQSRWVMAHGADPSVKDLARVLRVPGTRNYKYDPPPVVRFHTADFDRLYTLGELELAIPPDPEPEQPATRTIRISVPASTANGHMRRWADEVLERACAAVRHAARGAASDTRVAQGKLVGGLLAYNIYPESHYLDRLLDAATARSTDPDEETERNLRNGMAYGRAEPLPLPEFPTSHAPALRNGQARCPSCDSRIRRSEYPYPGTSTPGWYCPSCKGPMKWPLESIQIEETQAEDGTPPDAPAEDGEGEPPPRAFHRTDLGNARRLVAQHGTDLRFVPDWQQWLVWNGRHWERDRDGEVARRARATVMSIYADAALEDDSDRRKALGQWAAKSESRGRLESMVALAQAEDGIPVAHEDLDVGPYLLAVENGAIDLRTGALLPHDRAQLITKALPVAYDPGAQCPAWDAFLSRVLGGDAELVAFVRRAVGYTLTADTREQCLFFLYGTGRNGKSTFIEALLELLGPYGQKAPTEMLMARPMGGGIPNDVAQLPGVRYVVTAETEEGRRLNESLVKDLTGGDRMTARFMRAEFFQFKPTHKLWMYGNHKPVIRGTDNGIWRRMRAIPFTVTIPDAEVDPDLPARLRAELPGILAWAVAGCLEWQAQGLGGAAAVDAATAAYRAEMDVLGSFLDARCVVDPAARVRAALLYQAYKDWAEEAGEFVMSLRRFGGQLTERGFGQHKDRNGNIQRTGIGLLTDRPPHPITPPPPEDGGTTEERTMTDSDPPSSHAKGSHVRNIHVPPSSSVPPSIVNHEESEAEGVPPVTTAAALAARLHARRNGSGGGDD